MLQDPAFVSRFDHSFGHPTTKEGGHRNWQMHRCPENRCDGQKFPPTSGRVSIWSQGSKSLNRGALFASLGYHKAFEQGRSYLITLEVTVSSVSPLGWFAQSPNSKKLRRKVLCKIRFTLWSLESDKLGLRHWVLAPRWVSLVRSLSFSEAYFFYLSLFQIRGMVCF